MFFKAFGRRIEFPKIFIYFRNYPRRAVGINDWRWVAVGGWGHFDLFIGKKIPFHGNITIPYEDGNILRGILRLKSISKI